MAQEVRELVIDTIGEIGGHFGANLGTCELTVALHSLLDSPTDKILWDVGHQAYPHKILTGRKDAARHDPPVRGARALLLGLRVRARHHGRRPRLDLDRLRRRPQGGDAQGDRRGRQGRRGDRRRCPDRWCRLRGAPSRWRTADADGDRPERQRHVDLAQRRRPLPLLPARPPEPGALQGPLHNRGAAHAAAARPRPAHRAARSRGQGGDQGLLGAGPLLRGARPRLHGRDRRPRRRRPPAALTKALEADRPVVVHINTVKGKGFQPAEEGGLEGMEKWHAAKPGRDRRRQGGAEEARHTRERERLARRRSRSSRSRLPRRRRSTRPSSRTRWSRRRSAIRG